MWPFKSKEDSIADAIRDSVGECSRIREFLIGDDLRMRVAMFSDPYACGYLFSRLVLVVPLVVKVVPLVVKRLRLDETASQPITNGTLRQFFGEHFDDMFAVMEFYRTNDETKSLWEAGSRDGSLIQLYLIGDGSPTSHPMWNEAVEYATREMQGRQPTEIEKIFSLEYISFGRYLERKFPE